MTDVLLDIHMVIAWFCHTLCTSIIVVLYLVAYVEHVVTLSPDASHSVVVQCSTRVPRNHFVLNTSFSV